MTLNLPFWWRTPLDQESHTQPTRVAQAVADAVAGLVQQKPALQNAKQVTMQPREGYKATQLNDIQDCNEIPPPQPNAYTDGSLKHPRN